MLVSSATRERLLEVLTPVCALGRRETGTGASSTDAADAANAADAEDVKFLPLRDFPALVRVLVSGGGELLPLLLLSEAAAVLMLRLALVDAGMCRALAGGLLISSSS